MIKCPICGSTAQVKLNDKAILNSTQEWLSLSCECGCGCRFDLEYNINDYYECNINAIKGEELII